MAKLLVNLRHVPDDEAEEICAVLERHGIDFYEIPPGRWGISGGGIWLQNDDQLDQAKRLLEAYQRERAARPREPLPRKHPLQILIYLAIAIAILYFSIQPFLSFGG